MNTVALLSALNGEQLDFGLGTPLGESAFSATEAIFGVEYERLSSSEGIDQSVQGS